MYEEGRGRLLTEPMTVSYAIHFIKDLQGSDWVISIRLSTPAMLHFMAVTRPRTGDIISQSEYRASSGRVAPAP